MGLHELQVSIRRQRREVGQTKIDGIHPGEPQRVPLHAAWHALAGLPDHHRVDPGADERAAADHDDSEEVRDARGAEGDPVRVPRQPEAVCETHGEAPAPYDVETPVHEDQGPSPAQGLAEDNPSNVQLLQHGDVPECPVPSNPPEAEVPQAPLRERCSHRWDGHHTVHRHRTEAQQISHRQGEQLPRKQPRSHSGRAAQEGEHQP
mmetsp:Transcript_60826/g.163209  ORF Transcript_60826/g.163209 Transcript_60826/m.163209 type:complete len:206 (-) Transcript_60826:221-838(-)